MSSLYPSSVDADMDVFFDFNGGFPDASSSALSPSMIAPEHAEERQVFHGPTHDYGGFRQQTGLPSGSVSNVSAFDGLSAGERGFMSRSNFGAGSGSGSAVAGFGSSDMGGYNSGVNFDMDFETTSQTPSAYPTYFYPPGDIVGGDDFNDFVEPSAVAAYDGPPPPQQRMWPGMHSQQAQQAKADATARQQRQQQQGQQIMQERERQQSLASSSGSSQHSSSGHRRSRSGSQASVDPIADERISRILDSMRHGGNMSPIEEENGAADDIAVRTARMRKDEEEMDEDERLLASEEGKKLSSKERRQLRNKVSARAFRSRRKEYISQLEGEVAAKVNEATDLRIHNRKLVEENNQLKNLTRTLLRHPAFQTFLEDMSRDPTFIAPSAPPSQDRNSSQTPTPHVIPPAQETEKSRDTPKQEAPEPGDMQVNMAAMPQHTPLDMSVLNLGGSHWGSANTGFNFQQPQVFSVLELPEGPPAEDLVDTRILSGKKKQSANVTAKTSPTKALYPEPVETAAKLQSKKDATPPINTSGSVDPSFALYAGSPISLTPSSQGSIEDAARLLENSLSGKTCAHFRLVVSSSKDEETMSRTITQMFDSMNSVCERIDALTAHLPQQ